MRIAPIVAVAAVMMGTLVPIGAAEKQQAVQSATSSKLPRMWEKVMKIANKELIADLPKDQVLFVSNLAQFLEGQGIIGNQQNGFRELQAFVLQGKQSIFINGEHPVVVKTAVLYEQGYQGFAYFWATVLAHEALHLQGFGELQAWNLQAEWIRKFEAEGKFPNLTTFLRMSFYDQFELVKKDPNYSQVVGTRFASR